MVYRLAVRAMAAVRATPTPTPLLMRRMMPLRLPADDLRRIAGCPLKNRWMPQLCRVTQLLEQRRITIFYNSYIQRMQQTRDAPALSSDTTM